MASEGGGVEDECDQLRREVRSLWWGSCELSAKEGELKNMLNEQEREVAEEERKLEVQRCKVEEKRRKVEDLKRDLGTQLQSLRLGVEQLQTKSRPKSVRLKDLCSAREVDNTKRLDKLPPEVWEKVLDHLEGNDHFPLALSCRYFRQKQKELGVRTIESKPKSLPFPDHPLKTVLHCPPKVGQPVVSADYLRFCLTETCSGTVPLRDDAVRMGLCILSLVAFQGHMSLLQRLVAALNGHCMYNITEAAGKSSTSRSLFLLDLASNVLLHLSSSQHAEANWRYWNG